MSKQKAEIYTTKTAEAPGYAWNWRCAADGASSAKPFPLYFDCIADARQQGYEVELAHARGLTAPGGAGYALGKRDNTD